MTCQTQCSQQTLDTPVTHMMPFDETAFQQDVSVYWNRRAQSYSNAVLQELDSEVYAIWRTYLHKQIPRPANRAPRVLDLGCGPGFFDIIFAEADCQVTAVDSSEGMLHAARANLAAAGLEGHVHFHLGNVAKLSALPSESFDLIVSRNVTWLMRDLRVAYAEWLRLLTGAGTLLTFDSNWYHYLNDEVLAKRRMSDEQIMKAEVPAECLASKDQERRCEKIAAQLSTTYLYRPGFDEMVLRELGAAHVSSDTHIWKTLWTPDEQRYFRTTPMFMVKAVK